MTEKEKIQAYTHYGVNSAELFEKDEYGEILLTESNAENVAFVLYKLKRSILLGFSDGETHYDIMFCLLDRIDRTYNLQSGRGNCDFYISILGKGSGGFLIQFDSLNQTESGYYAEKLNIGGGTDQFTNFFNFIRKHITVGLGYKKLSDYVAKKPFDATKDLYIPKDVVGTDRVGYVREMVKATYGGLVYYIVRGEYAPLVYVVIRNKNVTLNVDDILVPGGITYQGNNLTRFNIEEKGTILGWDYIRGDGTQFTLDDLIDDAERAILQINSQLDGLV